MLNLRFCNPTVRKPIFHFTMQQGTGQRKLVQR